MSFASDARGELTREKTDQSCCARAELAAALLFGGGISYRGRGHYLLRSCRPTLCRATLFRALQAFFRRDGEIRTLRTDQLRQTRYQLSRRRKTAAAILRACGLLDDGALFGVRAVPTESALPYACCRKAFLRGAFLLAGTVSNPERGYHSNSPRPVKNLPILLLCC